MNTHTKTKIAEVPKTYNTLYMIEVTKVLSYNQHFILRGLFSLAPMMYIEFIHSPILNMGFINLGR